MFQKIMDKITIVVGAMIVLDFLARKQVFGALLRKPAFFYTAFIRFLLSKNRVNAQIQVLAALGLQPIALCFYPA